MALATQCPHCYTSFRVANDQLKLHAGMVRCGACKQTFNGIEHLLAPGATPKSPPNKNQAFENSLAPTDNKLETKSTSTDVLHHDPADADIKFEGEEVNSTAGSSVQQATPATIAAKQTESSTDVAVDLPTSSTTFLAKIGEHQPSETFESSIESQTQGTPISTMSSDRSQASLLEIMSSTAAKQNTNNEIKHAQQSAVETVGIVDLLAPIETDQSNAIELALDSNLNKDLPAESISTAQVLPSNIVVETNVRTVSPATNANASASVSTITSTNQLNTETDSQADPDAVPSAISTTDAQTILQTKAQQQENEPGKTQSMHEVKKPAKKPGALTASLDFELSKEERESVDEIAHIHQLELETRAAVLDEATDEWSNHEPQTVQDGFKDSLKELKPILDDIGDFGATHQATAKSNTKHQTLNDLRVSNSKTDSVTDLETNSNRDQDVQEFEVRPAFVLQAEQAKRFSKWKQFGLGFGVFLFVLAGAAQTIYFLRSDIAAMAPQLKPQLLNICKTLSCQIKLPAQKSMLEITGSELLIVNEELGMNTLSVQIQNKSNTVQAWPHFDLTLKDRRGKDLLQKAFTPTQYLENKDLLSKGMPATSESNHKIFFQLNGLKASDYTVEIFYP